MRARSTVPRGAQPQACCTPNSQVRAVGETRVVPVQMRVENFRSRQCVEASVSLVWQVRPASNPPTFARDEPATPAVPVKDSSDLLVKRDFVSLVYLLRNVLTNRGDRFI